MIRRLFCVLLLAGTGGLTPAASQNAPAEATTAPTAADFGALPIVSGPLISPDGKRVTAKGLIGGKQLLLVIDVSTPERAIRRFNLPEKHQLEWVRWAGNDRLLASLSRITQLEGEDVRMTRLAMVDLSSNKQTLIGPREQGIDGDDLVHVDREGKFLLLSTQPSIYEYPAVYRVDLDTGKSKRIIEPVEHIWDWFADSTGTVRGAVGIDGSRTWLLYRSSEKDSFHRVLRRDASRDDANDKGIQQMFAVPDGDQGYAIADGKAGHFALYRYDFKNDALGELLYENPTVDVDDFEVARDGTLISVNYIDDRREIAWFDPAQKKLQSKLDRALPTTINRVVSVSEDRNRMIVWSASATEPGVYMLFDRAANRLDGLVETNAAVSHAHLSPMESVRYKARDGLEIRAYLTMPAGRPATGLPMIVMPHGGPFARDEWGYDPWVQYLASKGYVVLQPNFRGSTGFGRAFVEKGTGQWGRGMQDDIDDGVKWLAAKGTVDPKRVCIMGASFGGYAAMWAAVRNPEMYRCAISFAGVSDVASMLRYDSKSLAAPRYFRDWRNRVRGEKGFDLDQVSPIKQVERMTVPILLAHGADDDNVPLYQSRRLHEALLKLKREHEYVVYPDEGHGFTDAGHSTDFLTRVGAFLDKHNPS